MVQTGDSSKSGDLCVEQHHSQLSTARRREVLHGSFHEVVERGQGYGKSAENMGHHNPSR